MFLFSSFFIALGGKGKNTSQKSKCYNRKIWNSKNSMMAPLFLYMAEKVRDGNRDSDKIIMANQPKVGTSHSPKILTINFKYTIA